jgi:hypothetical protein
MMLTLTPRRIALFAIAALALPVVLSGCAKKITSADAGYVKLEGTPNPDARLTVWPDQPNTRWFYTDLGPPGPSPEDTLLLRASVYRSGPGAYQVLLLDGSDASGFEMFRRASNGGFEPMRDFVLNSPRKWLDSHWELYQLTDGAPSGFSPPTYMGRGLLAGMTTALSPLTNPAVVAANVDTNLKYIGDINPVDSLFTMAWEPVAGAAGYWLHVYQFRSDTGQEELVESGSPSPVWNGKVRDYFVGWVDASVNSYRLGDPGALVLTRKAPLRGQVYLVRITALNAQGEVISYMTGSRGFIQEDGRWSIFPLAGQLVNPGGHASPAFGTTRSRPEGIETGVFGIRNFGILGTGR